jgi:hypothetical protein
MLAEERPFPLSRVSDKHYRARTDLPVLYNHRQFNEWKEIHVFDTKPFLPLRRWSHVVSSRSYVSHRTEQPIHGGVASNHGSYKLCFHVRQRFPTGLYFPVRACVLFSNQHSVRVCWFVMRATYQPIAPPKFFFYTRVCTAVHSLTFQISFLSDL